jgi:hypothetical protein
MLIPLLPSECVALLQALAEENNLRWYGFASVQGRITWCSAVRSSLSI